MPPAGRALLLVHGLRPADHTAARPVGAVRSGHDDDEESGDGDTERHAAEVIRVAGIHELILRAW